MTTIYLMGGLGNQLFQWALGLALESRLRSVQYDVSSFIGDRARRYMLADLGWDLPLISDAPPVTIEEKTFAFNPEALEAKAHDVLRGYWQSEKYFGHLRNYIRGGIFNRMRLSSETLIAANMIERENSCFLHIRRSDNLRPTSTLYHGLTSIDAPYYAKAIALARERIPGVTFFAFSDDHAYLETIAHGDIAIGTVHMPSFVEAADHNLDVNNLGREVEDLYLMSRCRNGIIANSTFSWWGAYLGEPHSGRLNIAPDPWFNVQSDGQRTLDESDVIPEGWEKVSTR